MSGAGSAAQCDIEHCCNRSSLPRACEIDAILSKIAGPYDFTPVFMVTELEDKWRGVAQHVLLRNRWLSSGDTVSAEPALDDATQSYLRHRQTTIATFSSGSVRKPGLVFTCCHHSVELISGECFGFAASTVFSFRPFGEPTVDIDSLRFYPIYLKVLLLQKRCECLEPAGRLSCVAQRARLAPAALRPPAGYARARAHTCRRARAAARRAPAGASRTTIIDRVAPGGGAAAPPRAHLATQCDSCPMPTRGLAPVGSADTEGGTLKWP